MEFKPATYVSVWDGDTEIRTSCMFNPETKEVKEIEVSEEDIEDLDILDEEYIEFLGEKYEDFYDVDAERGHGSFSEDD